MKETIIKSLKQLVADRYLLVLMSTMIILAIIFAISVGLSIHSSERQLISHYSAFGMTHFYFGQWFYLFSFVLFGIVAAVLHAIIAIKLLVVKGHTLAIIFTWLGIGVILLGWIMASRILELRSLL